MASGWPEAMAHIGVTIAAHHHVGRLGVSVMRRPTAAASFLALAGISALTASMLTPASLGPSSAEPGALAKRILDRTGVKGGLVIHIGCGDGRLTAALHASDSYLVQGLDPDIGNVERARGFVASRGLYGPVTVRLWNADFLPYIDNVAQLIVSEDLGHIPPHEVMRVLAPGGVAYIKRGWWWIKRVKKRPADIDEWTHLLHGPDNNAVAHDARVGPPRHLQWLAPPRWARSHDHLASVSVVVSSGGRVFYIVDEGPTAAVALPARWSLVARNAFSGVLLWKRAVGPWEGHLRGFRSGPPELGRRLVAVGDRGYTTLGYGKPVTALDAATGKTVMVYPGTEGTDEIVYSDGVLYLAVGDPELQRAAAAKRRGATVPPPQRDILAIRADTGELVWRKSTRDTVGLMPLTLCVGKGRVFFQNTRAVVCLDARTGRRLWRAQRPVSLSRPAWSAPTLVLYEDVLLSADRVPRTEEERKGADGRVKWTVTSKGGMAPPAELIAFSIEDGRRLWSAPCREGYNAPVDVLVAGGLLWTGNLVRAKDPGMTAARDPHTGEIRLQRPKDQEFFTVGMGHHRCYRNKATDRYIFLGRAGVELIDVATGKATANHWVRGTCQYGIMPCNGLLYVPPHSCACYIEAKLSGFCALAAERDLPRPAAATPQLQPGPAYGASLTSGGSSADWPTYRADPSRSGRAPAPLQAKLSTAWRVRLGGRLSSLVVADGKLFVAQVDRHSVHALDAATGSLMWSYTADSRVDSPPTFYKGRVLFGSADGWVYCLRATDGELIWRFRAAPNELFTVAEEQLESLWPVHGNILVRDGMAYFAAGRSGFIDGGIYLYKVDVGTGKVVVSRRIDARDPATGNEPQAIIRGTFMPGVLPDVLAADGGLVYMRHRAFGPDTLEPTDPAPHLFSPAGFLDDSWWHRTYWLYGIRMGAGWGGWPVIGNQVPAGRILCVDISTVYGFGRTQYATHGSHVGLGKNRYRLFAAVKPSASDVRAAGKRRRRGKGPTVKFRWVHDAPIAVRAMLVAEDVLFVAGPKDNRVGNALTGVPGEGGAALLALSASDGSRLAEYELDAPPVFDSMAAADGRLYIATTDGTVVCFGPGETSE